MLNRKHFLGVLVISALICICLALLQLCRGSDPEKEAQVYLREKLISLSMENITSIEIRFFKYGKMIDKKCILTGTDLNSFLSYLHNSDLIQVGGHNLTLYESIIIVKYENKTICSFVGEVYSEYEFNKNALYIYNYTLQTPDGRYLESRYGIGLPVRVPGLGLWLSTKCPLGKR
jgi:hypothetical protein